MTTGWDDMFDVAQATYWWLADNHRGQCSEEYTALSRLGESYKPGAIESGPSSEFAKKIYSTLNTDKAIKNVEKIIIQIKEYCEEVLY